MAWRPATEDELAVAIERDWVGIDPEYRKRLSVYLVDPAPASIERFGKVEFAFIVARLGRYVVCFDDVEEAFGTAQDTHGPLVDIAWYDNLALTLRELERLGGGDGPMN